MNNDARELQTPTSPRRRPAVATVAVCAALFLVAIPSATAKTDNAKTVAATAETAAGAPEPGAPELLVTGEAEAPGKPVKAGAKHAKHDAAGASSGKPASATATPAGASAAGVAPANAKTHQKATKGEPAGQQATTRGEVGAAATAKPANKSPKAKEKAEEARQAKRAERETKLAERELRRFEQNKPPLKGKGGKVPPSTGTVTPPADPVAKQASVTPAVSATPTVVPTPVATGGTTPPSVETAHARPRHEARRAHRNPARGSAAPLASVPVAAALGTSALAASHAAHAARPHAAAPSPAPAAPQSPIVRTITRIVGVVPLAVWLLVGALLAIALLLAIRTAFVALRSRRLERQREQLLEDVGLLQAALLPAPPARLGPVGTTAAYRPAAGPGAGGDFYDMFALEDGQLGVIVGDISGHGRQALPHTALVRFTLRAYLEAGMSPRDAVQTAGAVLEHQMGDSFATVVAATYHPRDRVLVYACAGHPRPLVLGGGEQGPVVPTTVCSAPPIGVGMRTGTRQTVVSLPGRSQACFFTDGVVEARVGNELFGPERLSAMLAEVGDVTASALLDRVTDATDRRPDDMAACMLSIEGGEGTPRILLEELELDEEELASDRPEHLLLAYGVAPEEIEQFMSNARAKLGHSGSATLVLRFNGAEPHLTLRQDNVTLLHGSVSHGRERMRMSL